MSAQGWSDERANGRRATLGNEFDEPDSPKGAALIRLRSVTRRSGTNRPGPRATPSGFPLE